MRPVKKCCYDHWHADNRALRRRADRQCKCRGECGCKEKNLIFVEGGYRAES